MSGIGTKCVQAGYTPGSGEPRQVPIIQSTTFKYASSSDMGKLFDLEASGYFYSRLQNPTNDTVAMVHSNNDPLFSRSPSTETVHLLFIPFKSPATTPVV